MGQFVRTISLKRTRTKVGSANLAYNYQRVVFYERRPASA